MNKVAKKPTPKRQATEQRIIKAFEKVLRRDGAEKLGVNAIIKEAGVGKGLLYDYFGGLEGLAEAWVKNTDFVPSMEDIVGEPLETFREKSTAECIGQIHVNYATMLKQDKLAGQLTSVLLPCGGRTRKRPKGGKVPFSFLKVYHYLWQQHSRNWSNPPMEIIKPNEAHV